MKSYRRYRSQLTNRRARRMCIFRRNSLIMLPCVVFMILLSFDTSSGKMTSPYPNALFMGEKLSEFQSVCTSSSTKPCSLSSPEDFARLRVVKKRVSDTVTYYRSYPHLAGVCILLIIILILMTHLAIVRHFDWRTLPLANIFYDVEHYQDRTSGVKYHQYVWMKYLVLRGSHVAFRKRDFGQINWHRYKDWDKNFDYKSVKIQRFIFLDKKMLKKHLAEDGEKEADVDLLQTGLAIGASFYDH